MESLILRTLGPLIDIGSGLALYFRLSADARERTGKLHVPSGVRPLPRARLDQVVRTAISGQALEGILLDSAREANLQETAMRELILRAMYGIDIGSARELCTEA